MKPKQTKADKKPTKREQLRTKANKKIMLKQLVLNLGNVTNSCKAAKVHRATYYEWLDKDKDFREIVESIPEIRLDHYEAQLDKLIDEGNIAAVIFALKAKGKERNWFEKQEHKIKGNAIAGVIINILKPINNDNNKLETNKKADARLRDSAG